MSVNLTPRKSAISEASVRKTDAFGNKKMDDQEKTGMAPEGQEALDLLRASRMGISVLLDTAADFTEADQRNCEQARALIAMIDIFLTERDPEVG